MAIVLTKPLATDTGGYSSITGGSISSGGIAVADTTTTLVSKSVKWIVEITDIVNERISSYEILATSLFNNDVSFNRYGIVGNRINHAVNAELNGTNIELKITNNELVNITYKIARLEIK